MTCRRSAIDTLTALRRVRALREDIATCISNARFGVDADSDLADAIDCLGSWTDDGEAALKDAIREAELAADIASDEWVERRIVPHPVAAE